MGLFSFSQYDLLNESQRPRLQRARSHRCCRQLPDSARAHGDPPRPPSTQRTADGQHLHSKCIPCPQDRLKTTSEAQKQIFGPYCNFFAIADCRGAPNRGSQPKNTANRPLNGSSPPCREVRGSAIAKSCKKVRFFVFTKRFSAIRQISKGRITIMRRLRKGRIASARKSRKGRSLQPQANPVCFNDVHSGGCSPRAVPWSAHGCPLQPLISRRQL